MIFQAPKIGEGEERVLEQIRSIWRVLKFQIRDQPHRWTGFLRRSAMARGIRGSNSIEGIIVSDDDALAAIDREEPFEADPIPWSATIANRDAMTYALRVGDDPEAAIDLSLIRSLHFMMLSYDLSMRPGSWRAGPIYVQDAEGKTVYEAPDVAEVPGLMDELVQSINGAAPSISSMVTAAMAHLNLVMVHPFRDGNGRMGRCLQTLVLAKAGVYDATFGSVEEYLGANPRDYERVLAEVGQGSWHPENDARPWIRFMLTAHFRQASTALRRLQETAATWVEIEKVLKEKGLPDRSSPSLVEAAFGHRVRNQAYRRLAEVSGTIASRDLKALVEAGLLVPHGERRGRWYERSKGLKAIRDRHRQEKAIADPFGP